jgi:hypothetical protein
MVAAGGDAPGLHHLRDGGIGHLELQRSVHCPPGQKPDHLSLGHHRVSLVAGAPHALGRIGDRVLGGEDLHASGHHLCDGDAGAHHLGQETQQFVMYRLQRRAADERRRRPLVAATAEVIGYRGDVDVVGRAAGDQLDVRVERDQYEQRRRLQQLAQFVGQR